jgi:hypothetical protein
MTDTNEAGDVVCRHFVPVSDIEIQRAHLGAMGYVEEQDEAPAVIVKAKPAAKKSAKKKKPARKK